MTYRSPLRLNVNVNVNVDAEETKSRVSNGNGAHFFRSERDAFSKLELGRKERRKSVN